MFEALENGAVFVTTDPVKFPKASGFLWNDRMMIHMNCRGYAVAQYMNPEPEKYSYGPMLEAKTFMQPEQAYYTDHPGRYVFIKDEDSKKTFSLPYEPMRIKGDSFKFIIEKHKLSWLNTYDGIEVKLSLTLPAEDTLELWAVEVRNISGKPRKISVYPCFTVGYMSWMNQSGSYHQELSSILCKSVKPYQKYTDYFKMKENKDITFLMSEINPVAWEANREAFLGEGGMTNPSALLPETLQNSDAIYEMPVAVMQYRYALEQDQTETLRFLFGPAKDENEIICYKEKYFTEATNNTNRKHYFDQCEEAASHYMEQGSGCIHIQTQDQMFDALVNHWLPRQIYYHGKTNRLSTDPQTRNYLQDNMGMSYIEPSITRGAFLHALSQQNEDGSMPDGILLYEGAQLKYINQVPHTDHCTWLPLCLKVYLDETNDYSLLEELVPYATSKNGKESVFSHVGKAMKWLANNVDNRGLCYIEQGDWCDPMNMVGYKGIGVSGWLTLAAAFAFRTWSVICRIAGYGVEAEHFHGLAEVFNKAVNRWLWDGDWYARGITDDGRIFGVSEDKEGKIFLNPQSFAILSGAADDDKITHIIASVKQNLETPYGYQLVAPAFTKMYEDIGRVTQKFPGSAENGSIYNHAAAFYAYAMYQSGNYEEGFHVIRKMVPGPNTEDLLQREQLPNFIPNYYRGGYEYYQRTCGRSSQLFNTGTISWLYRSIVEELFGLKGQPEGLEIAPQFPSHWEEATVERTFRGAKFIVKMRKEKHSISGKKDVYQITVNGQPLEGNIIRNIVGNEVYCVDVVM